MESPKSITLGLECSAGLATAALIQDGEILGQAAHRAAHGHAAWMVPLAQDVMAQSGIEFSRLTHIVAGRGPGSFTGIRVALAAAKGLAMSLGIGATGLSSLAGMAAQVRRDNGFDNAHIITSVDSRRGSMFFQAFSAKGDAISDVQDGQIDALKAIMASQSGSWVVAGHAATMPEAFDDDVVLADKPDPEASGLLTHYHDNIGHDENNGRFIDLEPLYLSAPILGPR